MYVHIIMYVEVHVSVQFYMYTCVYIGRESESSTRKPITWAYHLHCTHKQEIVLLTLLHMTLTKMTSCSVYNVCIPV